MCVLVFYEGRDAHTHTLMNERERQIYIYIFSRRDALGQYNQAQAPPASAAIGTSTSGSKLGKCPGTVLTGDVRSVLGQFI